VLSPSDTCPDNNVRTSTGTRLIDFEAATVAHPAWDLAYLTVPWPTCWCAWRLPEATADRALQAWWDRVTASLPPAAPRPDRAAFDQEVRLAAAVWCLVTAGWFLPRAQTDGRAGGDGTPPSPQLRDVVQHRLGLVATGELPELTESRELAGRLSAALEREWRRQPLLLAPAFRDDGSEPVSPR
jgi:aminoglycoside/choline kinase family phosphotransferase